MKKGKRFYFVLLLCLLSAGWAFAQEDCAASWTALSVKKNITKGFGLTFREEYRSQDNLMNTEKYFFRLAGNYSICPSLSAALAYDYYSAWQGPSEIGNIALDAWTKHSHRLLADLQGCHTTGCWSFSLRERYVYAWALPAEVAAADELGAYQTYAFQGGPSHTLRTLPTITYAISNSMFSPYVAAELYNSLNADDGFKLNHYHLFLGTNIKLDKMNSLKCFYVCQKRMATGKRLHTIGLYYTITLP